MRPSRPPFRSPSVKLRTPQLRTPMAMRLGLLRGLAVACAAGGLLACGAGISQSVPAWDPSESELERSVRGDLLRARAFLQEGRLEEALESTTRGLTFAPDQPSLLRLRANLLERLGDEEQARLARERADLLDPPAPPPPDTPLDLPSENLLVVLLPPPSREQLTDRTPSDWPRGEVARTLAERLQMRLPGARVHHAQPGTVDEARESISMPGVRSVLSLRVDRAFCGETLKDGEFAVAWLRLAAARVQESSVREVAPADVVRFVVEHPRSGEDCRREAVVRALEQVFGRPQLRAAVEPASPAASSSATHSSNPAGSVSGEWGSNPLRILFPELGRRVKTQLSAGRRRLSQGLLAQAAESFRKALAIDPEDPDAHAFLREVERSLSLSRQLGSVASEHGQSGDLNPDYSAAQRRSIEGQLQFEKRRRDELMAALGVLDDDQHLPPDATLTILRPARIPDPDATGPRLARARSEGSLQAKVLYSPSGTALARYYFSAGESAPVLREDDNDGDGRPDRWVAYSDRSRSDVWEDLHGMGFPDRHLVYAAGGDPIERLEIDADGDGRAERIFRYDAGLLRGEDRDTDGDGRADFFEHFDPDGTLILREEDVNGDGRVDVRTAYHAGRIVRRDIVNPELLSTFQ